MLKDTYDLTTTDKLFLEITVDYLTAKRVSFRINELGQGMVELEVLV